MSGYGLPEGADVRLKTAPGETALHLIAGASVCVAIKLLLEDGADINSEDALFQTPLFKAIEGGNSLEVEQLLQRLSSQPRTHYSKTPIIAQRNSTFKLVILRQDGRNFIPYVYLAYSLLYSLLMVTAK